MATLSAANPSLVDLANLTMPNGLLAKDIIDPLAQSNDIWAEATLVEGNDGAGHKTVVTTGYPDTTWRKLYGGVPESKAQHAQVRDTCGMLEAYATIDKALADLAGGSAAWRMTQESKFREKLNQDIAYTFAYGDTAVYPERFMGIAPRFNSSTANNGANVIKGGGSGSDNAGIIVACWHPTTCHFIYPKGSAAGLNVRDLGEQTVYDASGNPFQALRSHYKWDVGLSVPDWRYVVRIPNIDVSDLTKNAASGADLVDLLIQAIERLPTDFRRTRPAIYCPQVVTSFLRRQITNKSNIWLSLDQVGGKSVMSFDGIPIRRLDQMVTSEALVS